MSAYISHTSVDCRDACTLSTWWAQVLDYVEDPDDPNERGHAEFGISARDGSHHLLFLEVPEDKAVKNRIHFDLRSQGELETAGH